MKSSTLHSLITAKALFEDARRACTSSDPHTATAGLIILQDTLELVLLAVLIEKDVDKKAKLESATFDQLIGYLQIEHVTVPHSGTLKAMNKQRVIAKHYAQLADVTTVKNYIEATTDAVDEILKQVIGKTFAEIYLTDLLEPGRIRGCLEEAAKLYQSKQYFEALIEIRKAIYYAVEREYDIENWKDYDHRNSSAEIFTKLWYSGAGLKADYAKRNKEWIEKYVRTPCDYVQIHLENLRVDALEWGVSTADIENLQRLTPNAKPHAGTDKWHIEYERHFPENEATEANTRECLDRAIALIHMQQRYRKAWRYPKKEKFAEIPAFSDGDPVYKYPRTDSEVIHRLLPEYYYNTSDVVTGFNPDETYYKVTGQLKNARRDDILSFASSFISGFLLRRPEVEEKP